MFREILGNHDNPRWEIQSDQAIHTADHKSKCKFLLRSRLTVTSSIHEAVAVTHFLWGVFCQLFFFVKNIIVFSDFSFQQQKCLYLVFQGPRLKNKYSIDYITETISEGDSLKDSIRQCKPTFKSKPTFKLFFVNYCLIIKIGLVTQ